MSIESQVMNRIIGNRLIYKTEGDTKYYEREGWYKYSKIRRIPFDDEYGVNNRMKYVKLLVIQGEIEREDDCSFLFNGTRYFDLTCGTWLRNIKTSSHND